MNDETSRFWFYVIDGGQRGPIPEDTLRSMLRSEALGSETPVWTEGMSDWTVAAIALPAYAGPQVAQLPHEGEALFFPISVAKYVLMHIATFGLYHIFWSYRSWQYIRVHDQRKISPFWRSWFNLFFMYELLKTIRERTRATAPVTYSAGWLTVAWVALQLSSQAPAPFGLVSALAFLPVIPVVEAVNVANAGRVAEASMNRSFSAWNIVGLVVGALLWGLVVVGAFGLLASS